MNRTAKNLSLVAKKGDSDPNMDEALHRVQTNLAYAERNRQLAAQVAREIEWGEAA